MIQRIQTVYLFVASIILFCATLFPLTKLFDIISNSFIIISAFKIEVLGNPISTTSRSVITIGILLYLTIILGFISIVLFKNRKLQLLLISIAMVLTFLVGNLIVISSYRIMPSPETSLSFTVYSLFPIIALVLFFMAYKAIKKDDDLVKSLDRIR